MFRLAFALVLTGVSLGTAAPKKIVLIAGPKSHGPVGNGIHDYSWSAKLLKAMLEHSSIKSQVRVEIAFDGWPRQSDALDDADTIMILSDGRDGDLFSEAPHLASPERVRKVARQMKRGCGLITFHFATFTPERYSRDILDWCGGYFQWEQNGKRDWYSAITTLESEVQLPAPNHPIARGLASFRLRDEFYYNLRFAADGSVVPIARVPALKGRAPDGDVVAWAKERPDGGRGFGTTCGHFYDNWKNPSFRKLILNAIAWTAHVEVPANGVEAPFFSHDELDHLLEKPLRTLILTGNEAHRWHHWEKSTEAILREMKRDPRLRLEVIHDPEDFARKDLREYAVILLNNYANWHDPRPLSEPARQAFLDFVRSGGGVIIIHFANGAWHYSLPNAGASDWPEYRRLVRRVWDHQGKPPSAHDPFGRFEVKPTTISHPITDGLRPFEVEDELYVNQAGEEAIEPLLVARSRTTGKDEPLAWCSTYGAGRVFQTLLGHSEKTYDPYETGEILRRAVAWCAGRQVRVTPPSPATPLRPDNK